jgi:hypothetical protein
MGGCEYDDIEVMQVKRKRMSVGRSAGDMKRETNLCTKGQMQS